MLHCSHLLLPSLALVTLQGAQYGCKSWFPAISMMGLITCIAKNILSSSLSQRQILQRQDEQYQHGLFCRCGLAMVVALKGSKCDHILRIFYPGLHMFHISCTRMTWQSVLHNSGGLSSDCMLDIKLSPDSVAVWSYCGSHQGQPVSKKLQVFHRLCGFGGSHLS